MYYWGTCLTVEHVLLKDMSYWTKCLIVGLFYTNYSFIHYLPLLSVCVSVHLCTYKIGCVRFGRTCLTVGDVSVIYLSTMWYIQLFFVMKCTQVFYVVYVKKCDMN